ncbi:RNA polymerase sigma factor [Polaribacter ponticola]|uniref:RNA polymerase sigma factor n=1 Tax=Polaribacter ponticola TaxID=2978475 RepID=UPI0030823DD0
MKSEKLVKALSLIDIKEKMILLMKYQDDMSIKEISEVLDIGESAVKMRIKRAKQKVVIAYEEL